MTEAKTKSKKTNAFSITKVFESNSQMRNLQTIIETHQDESAKNLGMSIINLLNGDHNEALDCLKFLVQNHPEIPHIHRRIAEIYISRDNFETAAEHLEEALKIDKEDLTAIVWLGLIHYELGNKKKAKICLSVLKEDVFFLNAVNNNWFEQYN